MKTTTTLFLLFTMILSTSVTLAQDEVSKREIIALLELRNRTDGENWMNTWDLSTPITQWHGVKVKDGKVVALDLAGNNLSGNLPLTIGNLKNLEYLDLSDNQLTGKLPRELRKFDYLTYLDVSGNDFEGTLPKTINRLQSIVHLNLSENGFVGELPHTLVELNGLNCLALSDNQFEGGMPSGMESLTKLKKLYLANNQFKDLSNLKILSEQQLVLTDVDVNSPGFKPIDFTSSPEGFTKLKFEDEE